MDLMEHVLMASGAKVTSSDLEKLQAEVTELRVEFDQLEKRVDDHMAKFAKAWKLVKGLKDDAEWGI